MRRWLGALALAGTMVTLLGGCVQPTGTDGDLTGGWPALRPPQPFVPSSGVCLPRITVVVQASTYETVDCTRNHLAEALHVGAFTGRTARAENRPDPGSPALRTARTECDKRVREVLGGDWRSARLSLTIAVPTTSAWSAGARWYRCDVAETDSIDNARPVNRIGSLRGALVGDSPLSHSCFDPKLISGNLNYMAPVLCSEPHRAEFVGVYQEEDMTWEEFGRADAQVHRRCMELVANFAAVPVNSDLSYRTGSIFYPPSQREWEEGDRGIRCFLWSDDRKLTRSMRGAGPTGLPVI
ncbi:septum formation family protein [Micromonospora sp. NPDC000207]|uniref:septum formation family protein n=1 Tax=Micromonospora sp. NPDC000207 TaxID=3154246 RepID=UPI00331E4DCE